MIPRTVRDDLIMKLRWLRDSEYKNQIRFYEGRICIGTVWFMKVDFRYEDPLPSRWVATIHDAVQFFKHRYQAKRWIECEHAAKVHYALPITYLKAQMKFIGPDELIEIGFQVSRQK